jgi:hypothetical protein
MELMESFAHQTNIIYVNQGRPQKSLFFQNWDYSSSTMMQNNIHHSDSDTAGNSSSASGRSESGLSQSWDVIPPLQNVSIGTSFHTLIEEQKKNQFLTDQHSDFNHVQYRTLPVNSSQGGNVIQTAKKVCMTPTDQINWQTVASYLWEAVWPTYKMLPKS